MEVLVYGEGKRVMIIIFLFVQNVLALRRRR